MPLPTRCANITIIQKRRHILPTVRRNTRANINNNNYYCGPVIYNDYYGSEHPRIRLF